MRVLGLEFRLKEAKDTYKTHRSNTHVVDHDSDNLDDEEKVVYAAEFVWPSKSKPSSCPSLKPTQKIQQNEVKFTFDVSKYDHIIDELLKNGNDMPIVSGIILFRMLLMIVMFFAARYNRPLMKDDWYFLRCKLTRHHSLCTPMFIRWN